MGLYVVYNRANMQSGLPENIADVVANLDLIATILNGGIDASNFGAGPILLPSKLSQEAAAVNQYLAWNGTIWAPRDPPLIRRSAALTGLAGTGYVANTLTEVMNFTIPANALSLTPNKVFRVAMGGSILNNSGVTRGLRIKILLGASTLWDSNTGAIITASANTRGFYLNFDVMTVPTVGNQGMRGRVNLSHQNAATTGYGSMDHTEIVNTPIGGTSAVDTTVDQNLVVQMAFDGTHANLSGTFFTTIGEVV